MRTLKSQDLVRDTNESEFPQGTIQNETDFEEGTPVVREVYGDLLTNIYKLLELTKEVATNDEDSESTQYQIINALRKFTNELNDQEQTLTKVGTNWKIKLDLDLLPENYFVITKAAETYNPNLRQLQRFIGDGATPIYDFETDGFTVGDVVLIIVNSTITRAISLTKSRVIENSPLYTGLGAPLAYNETDAMMYELRGSLVFNDPKAVDLLQPIKTLSGNPNAVIYDTVSFKDYVLCMVLLPGSGLGFFQFPLSNLSVVERVDLTIVSGGPVVDVVAELDRPYMYCNGDSIFVSNDAGTTNVDESLAELDYDPAARTLSYVSTILLDANFTKTTNAVLTGTFRNGERAIYTLINSVLRKYPFTGGETVLYDLKTVNGIIFSFDSQFLYTNGETAVKWNV